MTYSDADFGTITVTVNPRARRIIMRAEVGGLRVTAPQYAKVSDITNAIDKHREALKLRMEQARNKPHHTEEEIAMMRLKAKALLPRRVAELAYMHGFSFLGVKIQSSRTRWGSCSSRNSINLSLFLMPLPEHLIDYVILHELCHTVHHDHSERFWALMSKVTNGKAAVWNKELKKYHTD